jgi:hypothetical protein
MRKKWIVGNVATNPQGSTKPYALEPEVLPEKMVNSGEKGEMREHLH